MNAHINHDLALALVQTHGDRGTTPNRESDHYRDYTGVNAILGQVETQVKPILLTGVLRRVDGTLGPLDDVIAMWNVGKAREGSVGQQRGTVAPERCPAGADGLRRHARCERGSGQPGAPRPYTGLSGPQIDPAPRVNAPSFSSCINACTPVLRVGPPPGIEAD